jgi:hypothetical protein
MNQFFFLRKLNDRNLKLYLLCLKYKKNILLIVESIWYQLLHLMKNLQIKRLSNTVKTMVMTLPFALFSSNIKNRPNFIRLD